MSSPTPLMRLLSVMLTLMVAALACNLQVGADATPASAPVPVVERPTVEIAEPLEGATFRRGQTVSVRARASSVSGVTLVELLVNGIRVASQPPPEGASPPSLDVLLDYVPEQTGTVALAVRAYSSAVVGQPATRSITVLPDVDTGQGGVGTPQTYLPPSATPYNPQCRARMNVNLNYRAGPGVEYGILSTLRAGDEAQIVGYADRADGRWWQVAWGGQWGWLKAAYTTQLGDCSAIRPAVVPPTPSPIPSVTPLPTQPGTTAIPTLPDLRLSLLDGPRQVELGADGTARATYHIQVQNAGGQPAGQFRLAALKPDGTIDYYDVPGLNPGQAFPVPSNGLTVQFNSPGLKRILVTVDDTNRVAESNENNNQAYIDIAVNPGPPTHTPPPAPTTTPFPTSTPAPTNTSPPSTDGGTGELRPDVVFDRHGGAITGLAFSPDGLIIASSSRDGTVRLWNVATQQELLILSGHTDRVMDVAYHPAGSLVASASWDSTVRLWNVTTGETLAVLTHGAEVSYVAFSPDGSRVASGGANPQAQGGLQGLVRVWDVTAGTELAAIQTFGPITGVDFLNAGTVVAATAGQSCQLGGGAVELFDAATGASVRVLEGSSEWITGVAVDPGSGMVAGSGHEGLCAGAQVVRVWSGGVQQATLTGASATLTGLAFSGLGGALAGSGEDGTVWLWNPASGQLTRTFRAHNAATAVAFSRDGLLATGGADGSIRIWRLS